MGKNTPKAPKASMPPAGPARQKMISVPMPQLQADKIIGRVEQPLAKHYNGQGLAQASHFLPLSDDDFQTTFEALWDAHVEFGTSRSHKKLLGKRKHEGSAIEAGAGVAQPGPRVSGRAARRQQKEETAMTAEASAEPAARNVPAAASRKPPAESAGAAAVASHTLANKGRFAGTLAAKLLSGGGGT